MRTVDDDYRNNPDTHAYQRAVEELERERDEARVWWSDHAARLMVERNEAREDRDEATRERNEARDQRDALRRALENILEATGYADAYGLAQEALTTLDERSK